MIFRWIEFNHSPKQQSPNPSHDSRW